jgi:hypothetical protein
MLAGSLLSRGTRNLLSVSRICERARPAIPYQTMFAGWLPSVGRGIPSGQSMSTSESLNSRLTLAEGTERRIPHAPKKPPRSAHTARP